MAKLVNDILMDHNFDGIQEFDNDMPPWWLKLFYFTIIIAVVYLFYYQFFGIGLTSEQEYLKEIDPNWTKAKSSMTYQSPYSGGGAEITPAVLDKLSGFIGKEITSDEHIIEAKRLSTSEQYALLDSLSPDENLAVVHRTSSLSEDQTSEKVDPLVDDVSLAAGKDIWIKNCVACHGIGGEGSIGPNLTDQYWIHGGGINDIIKIINIGVPAKGMISWKASMPPAQIHQVASYILTLAGTNPANAKPPQGELYNP